jgi:rsbT co-antagonist protein RsbR
MTKARITLILIILLLVVSIFFAIQSFFVGDISDIFGAVSITSAVLMSILLFLHLRNWAYSHLALVLVLAALIVIGSDPDFVRSQVSIAIFVPTIIASITLAPRWILPVFLFMIIGIALRMTIYNGSFSFAILGPTYELRNFLVLLISAIGLTFASSLSRGAQQAAEQNAQKAQDARRIVEAQSQALEKEVQVAQAARAETEKASRALTEQLATIQSQRAVIQEMSVPILPITAQALLMPLIGALDTTRLQMLQERGLLALERNAARYLLLDVSGVPIIDTQVAAGLLQLVEAARLLGAQVVVVGVRPEVAQSIVGLGLTFNVTTRATLQDGISYILSPKNGAHNVAVPTSS